MTSELARRLRQHSSAFSSHLIMRSLLFFFLFLHAAIPAFAQTPPSIDISLEPPTYIANEEVFISGMDWPADQLVTLKITEASNPAHPVDIRYANADAQGDIDAEYIIPHHGTARTFTLRAEIPGAPDYTQEITFTTTNDPPLPISWWPDPEPSETPWVKTNKDDYQPDNIVVITGSGWDVGEIVSLTIEETGPQNFHPYETLHAVADDTGSIYAGYVIQANDLGQSFVLTATGLTSQLTAQTTFTDSRLNTVSVANQNPPNPVPAGSNATFTVTVGFNGNATNCTVDLSVSGLPIGASFGSFSLNPVTGSSVINVNSTLTLNTSSALASGTYPFTVTTTTRLGCQNHPTTLSGSGSLVVAATDTTPPTITPNVSGTLGNNDWYTSNVTVTWTVTDNESTISSQTGCGPTTINTNTTGTTLTCTATSAGGITSQSVTIKRDATAPTITFTNRTPAANGNGWNNSDVMVNWSCSDSTSGAIAASVSKTVTTEGTNQSSTGTCTDNAGNTASNTQNGINIDKTKPVITGNRTPAANANGWNNTDVVISFTCTDSGSGIDTNTVAGTTVSTEGENQSVPNTGTCTDKAGNTADPATVNGINIDKTAPMVNANALPGPNGNGWNDTDVTVTFSGSDGLSGIDTCDSEVILSNDGAGQSATGSCTDIAGNSASATASGINIDTTAPTLNPVVIPNPVLLNGSATASAGASDSLSGIDSQGCDTPVTNSVGPHTIACTATDNAGNTANGDGSYTVQYASGGTCYGAPGHAILQPIDADGSSVFKWKSTVPAKLRVCDANGVSIGTAGVVSSFRLVQKISGTTVATVDEAVVSTTPDTAFRWSSTDQQWIFNMNSKSLSANYTYVYRITLNDLTTIDFQFGLK